MENKAVGSAPSGPEILWDSEERSDWAEREGHIRDKRMYFPSFVYADMKEAWGAFSAILTSTNVNTGEVTVGKALGTEKNAIPVHLVGAKNAAECSWWRPLKKLGITVPEDRQYNIPVYSKDLGGKTGVVFIFKMGEYKNVPRNLKEESDKAAQAKPAPVTEAAVSKQGETTKPAETPKAE